MGELKLKSKKSRRLNVLTTRSNRRGVAGIMESALRRFRNLTFFILLAPVCTMVVFAIGVSLVPGFYVFNIAREFSALWPESLQYLSMGCALALGYILYGLTLIFVLPLLNFLVPFKMKEFRGVWFSLPTIPWYIHNALVYVARYTFLEFITPTPLNILFYRMMGMKIGKGVTINSTNISDPCMIELEDYVTIGGSAHVFAHYGQRGFLVIQKVKIGRGTTIGLKASVMGGVKVGRDCNIKPHTALLPKTVIPDNTNI